jgi:hypothetical protein
VTGEGLTDGGGMCGDVVDVVEEMWRHRRTAGRKWRIEHVMQRAYDAGTCDADGTEFRNSELFGKFTRFETPTQLLNLSRR